MHGFALSKDELSVREIDNGVVLGEPMKTDQHAVAGSEVEDLEFDYLPVFCPFRVNNRHLDLNIVLDPLIDCVVHIVDRSSCLNPCLGVEFVGSYT